MPSFPAVLPPLDVIGGFTLALPDNVIRTSASVGPEQTRRRFSAMPTPYAVQSHPWTRAQLLAFRDWHAGEIGEGALAFGMTDPVFGDTGSFRFDGAPSFSPSGRIYWVMSAQLMRLP